MKLKVSVIVLFICCFSSVAFSQTEILDALKTLERINAKYKEADDFILDLTYKMNNTDNGVEIDKIAGTYKKKGDKIFYKLGALETGYEEKMNIVLDPFENTVILSKGVLVQPMNLGDMSKDIMDAVMSKATVKEISSSKTEITIEMKEGDILKAVVTYNPNTMLLTQVETFYRRKYQAGGSSIPVKITITYNNFKTNAGLKREDFLLAKCLMLSNGTYKLKPAYNSFKLLNTVPKTGSL